MALTFSNVTYTFYTGTLGRSAIPDQATFNNFALENKLFVKQLYNDGMLFERETNGIDSAVCMMCEVDYNGAQIANGESDGALSSESLGAYSYSTGGKEYDTYVEQNAKSISAQKMKWLKLYCDYIPSAE